MRDPCVRVVRAHDNQPSCAVAHGDIRAPRRDVKLVAWCHPVQVMPL